MKQYKKSGLWKKHGIALLALVVAVGTLLWTGIPGLLNWMTAEKAARYYVELKDSKAYKARLSEVYRKALTANAIVQLTNEERVANGLPALTENSLLNTIAEMRAKDMLEKDYFEHISPTGEQASDLAQYVGYQYEIIAENIGAGDFINNRKIVNGWMQSPGHRENILSRDVQEIGAAILKGKMKGSETYIAVQIFGLQSRPLRKTICVEPSENLLRDIEVKKAEIDSLQDQLERLRRDLDAEKAAIDTDRKFTQDDARKIHKLNIKINAYNEKSRWYNRVAEETHAKANVTESMIREYNHSVQAYNECLTRKL